MSTVLFDLYESQPAGLSKFHGGGEYIKSIFKNLVTNYSAGNTIIVYFNYEKFLDDWVLELIDQYHIKKYDIRDRKEITKIFNQEKIDVFFSGIPYHYSREYIPKNVVFKGTIHGLRTIEMPSDKYAHLYCDFPKSAKETIKRFLHKSYRKKEINKFQACMTMLDEIITDSEHSKYSIVQKYPDISPDQIQVFYAPPKNTPKLELPAIEEKFILLLGGDRWVKNTYRAIQALEKLFAANQLEGYSVYVVGNINKKIKRRIKNISRYKIFGDVESTELEKMYQSCCLFFYPSLNEGFGLPPLEAMRYGKTCIVSGICSLPEICGAAVYYVNPNDIDEMALRILCAIDHPIKEDDIIKQFTHIESKQKSDNDEICKFIVDSGSSSRRD